MVACAVGEHGRGRRGWLLERIVRRHCGLRSSRAGWTWTRGTGGAKEGVECSRVRVRGTQCTITLETQAEGRAAADVVGIRDCTGTTRLCCRGGSQRSRFDVAVVDGVG